MYSKLRNSFIGFAAVVAFMAGSVLFGEPLRADTVAAPDAQASTLSPEARFALAVLNATVSVAHASSELERADGGAADAAVEPGASQPADTQRPRNRRPALSMPYFSFASFLPRAPQES